MTRAAWRIIEPLELRRLLAGGFQFDFVYTVRGDLPAVHTAIASAAARWESILTADIPDVGEGDWGDPVDDVLITVNAANVDGPGKVLASASPRYRRPDSGLPITAIVTMDLADLSHPRLVDILTHELGHVLGIGASWSNQVSDYGGEDPQFLGPAALAEYRAIAGDLTLPGVPVENTGNPGTRDVHWRESTFFNELMTGFYNSNVLDPLSRMSAAALIDLGFPGVSLEGADPYNLPGGNPIPTMDGLAASASTIAVNSSFTLTATNVANAGRATDDAGAGVARVRFYRESNDIPGLQATGNLTNPDQLVASVTGGAWQTTVDTNGLPAGTYTYYTQAVDVLGATSATSSVNVLIALPPPTPATPVLDAASDHGLRNDDGITNVSRPTLGGVIDGAVAGTIVDVFADGIAIGQSQVTGGSWSFIPDSPLADGAHAITVVARSSGLASGASAALHLRIDTLAPRATASRFEFATRLGVAFDFDEDVSGSLDVADIELLNMATGEHRSAVRVDASSSTAFFSLAPLTLPRGDYVATLSAAAVSDLAGNTLSAPATASFSFLPGDVDHSRRVDAADLAILSAHYNAAGSALDGDLDYNGVVDFSDLVVLAQNYGTTLDVVRPIVAAALVAKKKPRIADGVLG